MLALNEKQYHRLMLMVLGLILVLVLFTFRDYGITWDEELQSQYGLAVVDYYVSLFKDDRYKEIFNLYLYGGMFDGLASIIDRYTPFVVYDTRHLLNAMFGVLGLWGTWRLGRFMGGGAVGLLSMLFLALTPMYYGHMFNNPKDIPFACGVVWTLYFMSRCYVQAPHFEWRLLIRLSIIYGLTLGVRVGGVMLLFFWLTPVGYMALVGFVKPGSWRARLDSLRQPLLFLLRAALPVVCVSYMIMLICWPWAQQSPVLNPLHALNEFSNFPQDVEVLLNGTIYHSTQLPWYYVPLYFLVQLPELVLVMLVFSCAIIPWMWRRLSLSRRQALMLYLLTGMVPITFAMFRHPALYDAVRHFLFVVPLLSVMAAFTGVYLSKWAIGQFDKPSSRRALSLGIAGIFLAFSVTQICVMRFLHPYEYIYANTLTGGVVGAYGNYELDYWGTSFKEAAEQLQQLVAREGGVPRGKIYRIAICGPWDAAMIYLPPNFEPVVANQPAEFFLSTTRWKCQNMRPGKEVIRIERNGVPLSVVKDLRS